MKVELFYEVLEGRIERMKKVLGKKAGEYAREGDRLSNFKRAAAMLGTTPEAALMGMLAKHLVSILDMVDDLDRGKEHPRTLWDEKVGDAVNYLVLLEALVLERIDTPRMMEDIR